MSRHNVIMKLEPVQISEEVLPSLATKIIATTFSMRSIPLSKLPTLSLAYWDGVDSMMRQLYPPQESVERVYYRSGSRRVFCGAYRTVVEGVEYQVVFLAEDVRNSVKRQDSGNDIRKIL